MTDDGRAARGEQPVPVGPDDGPPMARGVFDRAAHRRSDAEWLHDAWQRARIVLVTPDSATPVDAEGRTRFATAAEVPDDAPRRFLGLADGTPYFAATVDPADNPAAAGDPAAPQWSTPRQFGGSADELDLALVIAAIGLEQWHRRHTHCPRCGAPTTETAAGWTRTCTADGSVHFPRTDPAVIMLVIGDDGRALLGRGHQWGPGRFSTLAGFVEPGESLEAAVAREVFEEVGVGVRDIRYLGSQPWPFPASLMLGFTARLDGDPGIALDPVEMAEAAWFTPEEVRRAADWTDDIAAPADGDATVALRAIPPHFSISRFLIDTWLAGRA